MNIRPLLAIRKYCLTRCASRPKEVRECEDEECPLYRLRMGKNPSRSGIGVGSRDRTGRFQSKIASPAGLSEKINEHKGVDKDSIASSNLGATSKQNQIAGLNINGKGTVKIEKDANGIVIRITPEQNREADFSNALST